MAKLKEHDENIQDLLNRQTEHTQNLQINYAEHNTHIENHTTSIEAIEAKIRNISGEGGLGLDMEALREEFAMRTPPDNTILRIEKIEAELNIDNGAGLEAGMSFKSTGGNN